MRLLKEIKRALYFPLAYYFRFWAGIRLRRWKPRVIVITGSSGKTTLLHLIESQVENRARYSHGANSSYGIPFDILGLKRKTLTLIEWPVLFLKAPFALFKKLPKEKNYVVEVDCDRPGEGKFLATLLKPEITLWLNSSKTHSINFDDWVKSGRNSSIEKAIAYEFGSLVGATSSLAIINNDLNLITDELPRTRAQIIGVKKDNLEEYEITPMGKTHFRIAGKDYSFDYLLPENAFYSIRMTLELLSHLNINPDYSFSKFTLPPGRNSVFKGIKNITIIDSTYNTNLDSIRVILAMFSKIPSYAKAPAGRPSQEKWVVLGDMTEQGESEKDEHEKLAELILDYNFDRVLLMGPRMIKYTYPKLQTLSSHFSPLVTQVIEKFLNPTEVLDYLKVNLVGGETVLFKGARFLEGVVEHLLENKEDAKKLCRREKIWQIRRRQWGL